MSTLVAKAYNPTNGAVEEIWEGFSWPCLFLGFIWYIYKGMWGWGVISFILAIFTWGLSWFIFPFFANEQHAKSLLKQGYLNEKQWNEKNKAEKQANNTVSHNLTVASVSDELSKLAALREQGILTDEEFSMQKRKLLS
jgi:hypothetical protein